MLKWMRVMIPVVTALALGTTAAPASAGSAVIMGAQGLSAGNAKSSSTGRTGILLVDGDANHTFCPSLAKGYSGYTSTPFSGGHFTAHSPSCGPHYQQWAPNGTSDIWFRGAVWNPNDSTFDTFTHAYYWW